MDLILASIYTKSQKVKFSRNEIYGNHKNVRKKTLPKRDKINHWSEYTLFELREGYGKRERKRDIILLQCNESKISS